MEANSELRWNVKYAPGTLLATGYKGGQAIAQDKVETTGAAARIKLFPDRASINADGEDVSIITVEATDAEGRMVPTAGNLIDFDLKGPGKIIGVGNGDPSCHEPDVYVEAQPRHSVALSDWRMKRVTGTRRRPETAESFDDGQWENADVSTQEGAADTRAKRRFWTHFDASADMLASDSVAAAFGMIDDDGWVYVNGHLAGESHDWSAHPSFEVRKFLHDGRNTIAVVVHNNESSGGVNKGVQLEIADKPVPAQWKRSVFNGLAQVIVQSSKEPGTLALTASGDGLGATVLNIPANAAVPRPAVP